MVKNVVVVDSWHSGKSGDVCVRGVLDSLMYMQSKDLISCSVYFFGMAIVCLLCFLMVTVLSIQFAASGGIEPIGIFVCVAFLALALGLFMRGLRSYSLGSAGLRHLARAGAV
jgi:hypothetical protein